MRKIREKVREVDGRVVREGTRARCGLNKALSAADSVRTIKRATRGGEGGELDRSSIDKGKGRRRRTGDDGVRVRPRLQGSPSSACANGVVVR